MRIEFECSCGARFEYEGEDYNDLLGTDGKAISDWPRAKADEFNDRHLNCDPVAPPRCIEP